MSRTAAALQDQESEAPIFSLANSCPNAFRWMMNSSKYVVLSAQFSQIYLHPFVKSPDGIIQVNAKADKGTVLYIF
jgi:hypothetical protein